MVRMMNGVKLTVGIAGCGTIGRRVAAELDSGFAPRVAVGAITSRDMERAKRFADTLASRPPAVSLERLVEMVDLVVEAAPASAMESIAVATLSAGKDLMALSGGALLERDDLFALAAANGATIYVPSGAIAGLDGVAGAAAGRVDSVTMVTRKPPAGLEGAPGIEKAGVDLSAVREPTLVFEGEALEACRLFPANVNVSAALSLAGIGARRTRIRIYADPTVVRNTHDVTVEGEFGRLSVRIENEPSPSNPRTGVMSALSALAALRRITAVVRVGT